MSGFAPTFKIPYYAVIFTSSMQEDVNGYREMADIMDELARDQEGYLGIESARADIGITVSYWKDLDSIKKWKQNATHLLAQKMGREKWYKSYKVRICLVERDYEL